MRHIYTFIVYLALPFVWLRLLWRSRKLPAYRQRIGERFAIFGKPTISENSLWLHAVSLGEAIAAEPLIRAFQEKFPAATVVITTTTPTGSERVTKTFADDERIFHVYLPYDVPLIIKRFLAKTKPTVCVIMETELWPNLIHICTHKAVPVLIANARLSARSAACYKKIGWLSRPMLRAINKIAAQTAIERARYIELGANPDNVMVTGSIKFDMSIPKDLKTTAIALRQQLGSQRPIWVVASTHAGEEVQLLTAFKTIRKAISNLLLVIVPRHPDRFSEVADLCRQQGYTSILRTDLRTENRMCDTMTDIFIVNTLGELLLFYAVSDVVFVGGSLVPVGGHNLLEPAALAKPILTGPCTHNFDAITKLLLTKNALQQVVNIDQLATAVLQLLRDKIKRDTMGRAAKRVVVNNRGALQKQVALLVDLYSYHPKAVAKSLSSS